MDQKKNVEAGRASSKAAHIIKKYNLQKQTCRDGREYFVLPTDHQDFEKLIGRQQSEVFKEQRPSFLPLGESASEAVISLYGLTNSDLYDNEIFKKAIESCSSGDWDAVVSVLRAAAYAKYDARHEMSSCYSVPIERTLVLLRIRPHDIVEEYRYLRG